MAIGAAIVGAVEGIGTAAATAAPLLSATGLAVAASTIGVSIGIGAALGALAQTLEHTSAAQTPRQADEILYTTSIRALPVPILFGRGRLVGNMIALGDFIRIAASTPGGGYLKVEKGVVSLGEGPFQIGGNFQLDNQTPKQQSIIDNKPVGVYNLTMMPGTFADALPGIVADPINNFSAAILVPWRNTAKLLIDFPVGPTPRMGSVSGDFLGPDLTIRRSGTTTETGSGDVPIAAGYDGYSQSFWYTLSASSVSSSPFGLAKIGRESTIRDYTAPPTAVTSDVTHAWYLGRHDIVVMQDPADSTAFWLGTWGIARSSTDWGSFHPSPGGDYSHPILASQLDELHGVLHTLHDDGTVRYVMQWTLLTGRVNRINTDLAAETYPAMMYSPDFDTYITVGNISIRMVDPATGITTHTGSAPTGTIAGLCVSGQVIGVVTTTGVVYWDPQRGTFLTRWGTSGTGSGKEHFGGTISAAQNSWTGHVTLAKVDSGQPLLINFIPSTFENIADTGVQGSPMPTPEADDGTGEPETQVHANFRNGWVDFSPAPTTFNARDWSYRAYASYNLVALEGSSSLAAAMWSVIALEPSLDSGRWGAGYDPAGLDLSSFEHVHAISVGQILSTDPVNFTTWYSEKYKFDLPVDSETSVSNLLSSEMLGVCNGYRTVLSGKLHVGIHRQGMIPFWHFDENSMTDGSASMNIIGRGNAVNRVRVQYTNAYLLNYRKDFAEANDEWDQSTRGRVQAQTLTLNGISRFVHADYLAKIVLDQILSAMKQVSFGTHFLAKVLVPGDGIEISSKALGLNRARFRIGIIEENEDGTIKVTCQQSPVQRDSLKSSSGSPPPPPPGDPGGPICDCVISGTRPDDDTIIKWFSDGLIYPAGTYTMSYLDGAFQKAVDLEIIGGVSTNVAPWYISPFDVVTADTSGVVSTVTTAPGSGTGYDSQTDAQIGESGANTTVTLTAPGPVGLRSQGDGILPDSGPPTFQLCAPGQGDCLQPGPPTIPDPPTPPIAPSCDSDYLESLPGTYNANVSIAFTVDPSLYGGCQADITGDQLVVYNADETDFPNSWSFQTTARAAGCGDVTTDTAKVIIACIGIDTDTGLPIWRSAVNWLAGGAAPGGNADRIGATPAGTYVVDEGSFIITTVVS
jgi:hypothetical protein